MTREQIRARIQEIGIIPGIRVSSPDDALFAAEVMCTHGIPIVEVTMTMPGALEVIEQLTRRYPEMIVGAGSIWHVEMARSCAEAGVRFLTSPGLDANLIYFAVGKGLTRDSMIVRMRFRERAAHAYYLETVIDAGFFALWCSFCQSSQAEPIVNAASASLNGIAST